MIPLAAREEKINFFQIIKGLQSFSPFSWGMHTWGGTQGEAVVDPCRVFSLPFQLSLMTAALKCLVLVLKTVDVFLTSGCSFCEIRLGCRDIQLCKPDSQEHGKTVWWLPLSLKFFIGHELAVMCSWLSPLLRYAAAWAAQVTYVQSSVHRTIANFIRKPIHPWLFSCVAILY